MKKCVLLCLFLLLGCVSSAWAAPANPANPATVQSLTPQAWAKAGTRVIDLAEGTELEQHYSLHTNLQGSLHVRFADGSDLKLGASTSVELADFAYGAGVKPSFVLNMTGGAARLVTGAIVERNPEGFKIVTPLGTVGVRGTTLDVIVTTDRVSVIVVEMASGRQVVVTGLDNVDVVIEQPGMRVDLIRNQPTPPGTVPVADAGGFGQTPEEPARHTGFAEFPHRDVGEQSLLLMEQAMSVPGLNINQPVIIGSGSGLQFPPNIQFPSVIGSGPRTTYPAFLMGMPSLPGGHRISLATLGNYESDAKMSANGGKVMIMGQSAFSAVADAVFIWAASSGSLTQLPIPAVSINNSPFAISGNGQVVAYNQINPGTAIGHIYNLTTNTVHFTPFPAINVYALSYDGSIAVGTAVAFQYLYRYDADGVGGYNVIGLRNAVTNGSLTGYPWCMNDDGTIIGGQSRDYGGLATIWKQQGAYDKYTEHTFSFGAGRVNAISADGEWVTGRYINTAQQVFVGRTSDMAWQLLPYLTSWTWAQTFDISDDGKVIVGDSYNNLLNRTAVFWKGTFDTSYQIYEIIPYLNGQGISTAGIFLDAAYSVSGDGSIILCHDKTSNTLYLARIDGDFLGLTTPTNVYASLASVAAGSSSAIVNTLPISQLPGISFSMGNIPSSGEGGSSGGSLRVWGSGTFSSDYSFKGDDQGAIGAAGATYFMDNGFSLGGGVFYGYRDVDGLWNSRQELESISFSLYGGYAPEATGIRASLGAMWQSYDLDTTRNYPNGAGMSTSSGKGSGWGVGIVGHLGWVFELHEKLTVQPFVEYTFQRLATPDYDERGGPFPVSYEQQHFNQNLTRLGADLQWDVLPELSLQAWLAWNHRFENEGPASSGRIIGWQSFYLPGSELKEDWGDTGLGLRVRFTDNTTLGFRVGFGIDNDNSGLPDVTSTMSLSVDI